MKFDVEKVGEISGVEEFITEKVTVGKGDDAEEILVYKKLGEEMRAFLVVRKNTIEVRCDRKLAGVLREKYESVMKSRYFGRGGIEIVNSGQLEASEIEDLVRLSYNLS